MSLENIILQAPQKSGVYIFKRDRKVLYIGKAKNIKKRLQQHLKQATVNPKELALIKNSDNVEWILTRNEFEALVLEVNLIQLHKPPYNVLHKYGGGYPVLLLTKDQYPTVKVVRGTQHDGVLFGPFLQVKKAYSVKRFIHKLFKLRTCDPILSRTEPCMDYHLGLCSAPCVGLISKQEYELAVESVKALLKGNVSDILPKLYEKIEEYSSRLLFENCARIRDQIKALESIAKGQSVALLPFKSADLFYMLSDKLGLFLIRGGKLLDKKVFDLNNSEELEELILGYYYFNPPPDILLSNFPIKEDIKKWIKERHRKDIDFSEEIPTELISLIEENLSEELTPQNIEEVFKKLGLNAPQIIEGFDISHFYGDYTTGSCVVWEKGKMNKKKYRRYRIRKVTKGDDYEALREVLLRRAKAIKRNKEPAPDIWLLDGGKGQLAVGVEVRNLFCLETKVMALAKGEEVLLTEEGKKLNLTENPILYRIFGLIRDEAHRFALTYSRKLRSKHFFKDILTNIKGVGETRKKIIYRNFESLYDLIEADESELKRLGLPISLKQEVKKYLEGG